MFVTVLNGADEGMKLKRRLCGWAGEWKCVGCDKVAEEAGEGE